jgi:hypothetical protein
MMDGDHKIAFDFCYYHCSFRTKKVYGSSSSTLKIYLSCGVEADIKEPGST